MATITRRGGSYRIRASVGYTVSGKQVQPSMTWTPPDGMTERQIQKELNRVAVQFEDSCKSGNYNGHIKFEIFIDRYFKECAAADLRHKTFEEYSKMKPRVIAGLGHLYLDKITPRHIKTFLTDLSKPGVNKRTGGGLAPKTIRNHRSFVSAVLAYAVNMDLINENPCDKTTPPAAAPKRRDWYTLEEGQALLDSIYKHAPLKYQAYFITALFGGYRREELGGFAWSDIGFDSNLIFVRRACLYTKERGTYMDQPKTDSSCRVLKQPQIIFDALRRWRAEQAQERLLHGDLWDDGEWVFTGRNGKPLNPNVPYWWLKRHCENHGLRFLGVHALRHLNAALLIRTGADVVTVAGNLGHSQPSTTMNIYAYEFAEAKAIASQAAADLLTAKLVKKSAVHTGT